jgi:UV excision repair protein RAD23
VSAPVSNVPVPPPISIGTTGVAPVTGVVGNVPSVGGESNLVVGEQYEASIQNLMGMGFNREEVVEALRAAYNNP